MNSLGVLHPWLIWLCLGLLPFAVILVRSERSISKILFDIYRRKITLSRSRLAIPLAITTLLVLALVRPYWGKETIQIATSRGRDVFLVFDVSISMLAQDISPSRLKFAQRKAQDIVAAITASASETRIGIILFAGDAYVFCPLTSDSAVIAQFLQHIDYELVTARGSALIRALDVTKQAITDAKSKNAQVVFLSDGEDLKDSSQQLIDAVASFPGKILFLGVGNESGAPIPLPQGGYLSANQQIVTTKMNAKELAYVFNQANAKFIKATLFDSDFQDLIGNLDSAITSETTENTQSITTYGELGPILLVGALVLTLYATWHGNIFTLLLVGSSLLARYTYAESNPFNDSPAYSGYLAYQEGNFSQSSSDFSTALKSDPNNPQLLNSLASAAFKEGKFAEAESLFNEASKHAISSQELFNAHYGAGNAALAQKRYQPAIDAYDKALMVQSDDSRAKHNRQIAQQLLAKEEKKDSQQPNNNTSQQQAQNQEPSGSKEQNSTTPPEQHEQSGAPTPKEDSTDQQAEKDSAQSNGESNQESNGDTKREPGDSDSKDATKASSQEGQSQGQEAETPSSETPSSHSSGTSRSEQKNEQSIPLSEQQAHEWLNSLPETPLLLQRLNKRERIGPGEQFW